MSTNIPTDVSTNNNTHKIHFAGEPEVHIVDINIDDILADEDKVLAALNQDPTSTHPASESCEARWSEAIEEATKKVSGSNQRAGEKSGE